MLLRIGTCKGGMPLHGGIVYLLVEITQVQGTNTNVPTHPLHENKTLSSYMTDSVVQSSSYIQSETDV